MSDENIQLSAKTWARTVDCINKVEYSDGVVNGQAASFQFSFDMGYRQGLDIGFKLGLKKAMKYYTLDASEDNLLDPRRINCQICLDNTSNQNVVNLYNRQLEKNNDYCTNC